MKTLITIFFSILIFTSSGQLKEFLLEGQIVDEEDNPISDVYIVNPDNNETDISHENGVFSMWVSPGDSLVLSHISYFRKTVTVYSLLLNPKVVMISEHVDIPEVIVSPNPTTDIDRANENINQIDWDFRPQPGDDFTESEQLQQTVIENNRVLRTEAASVSILKFSPSENIGRLFTKLKKKAENSEISSTRKTNEELDIDD